MSDLASYDLNTAEIIAQAEAGDAEARYVYGILCLSGQSGIETNLPKAALLLEGAAKQDVLYAMYHIGLIYVGGIGVEKDIDRGVDWLKKAADRHLPEANTDLGILYLYKDDVEQDIVAARFFLERGQALGDALAKYVLGNIHWQEYQDSVPSNEASLEEQLSAAFEAGLAGKDFSSVPNDIPQSPLELAMEGRKCGVAQAISSLEDFEPNLLKSFMTGQDQSMELTEQDYNALWEAARQGDVTAMHEVAKFLLRSGDTDNMATGIQILEAASKHGHSPSQVALGAIYAIGEIVEADNETSLYWYTQAANSGDSDGEYALGSMYLEQGDISTGKSWLEKASEHGNDEARYQLARLLLADDSPVKDEKEAIRLIRRAAKNGHADAMCFFGLCYANGEYLPHDAALAFRWMNDAAQKGQGEAQFYLGNMYTAGEGTEQDITMAKHWLRAAMRQGNIFAEFALYNLMEQQSF